MQTRKPRRGDVVELVVEGIDERGQGVGRVGEQRFRVRGAVPGSRVRATVRRRRKNDVEAVLDAVLERSRHAVEPRCRHFASCGGCSLQDLDYPAQLVELAGALERELAPFAGEVEIEPILGCEDPWNYRNKMDFTFGSRRWIEASEPADAPDGFALGLHPVGRHDKVLDVERCDIAFREASAILCTVRRLARERGLTAWDVRAHSGLLRHLVLRKGAATGEILAQLVTTEEARETVDALAAAILERHPEITTLVQTVNPGVALVATGAERVLHGSGRIHERLCGLDFSISAESFFQTNTVQAEHLARTVAEHATAVGPTCVHDLYCGCGTLSLPLARSGVSVVGFELVESAVADARRNAEANGIANARFVAGDLGVTLGSEPAGTRGVPEVCIVDPPRAGMHPRALGALRRLAPRRIVYVSCRVRSAVREMLLLRSDGYRVRSAHPIDLFPHTPHLECVFVLDRGDGGGA